MTQPTIAEQPRRGARTNALLELAGYLCLVAFAFACWPPAALAVAGVILVVTSNARHAKAKPQPPRPHWTERAARVLVALRGSG